MIKTFETVRNIKSGNTAWVAGRYVGRNGKAYVEVIAFPKNAHWLASNVEAA